MKKNLLKLLSFLSLTTALSAQIQLSSIVRDEYGLGIKPTVFSSAMGGAYLGVSGTDSINPAAISSEENKSVYFSHRLWDHSDGPDSDDTTVMFVMPAGIIKGNIRLIFNQLKSDSFSAANSGLGYAPIEFESNTFGIHYGVELSEKLSLGLGAYPYEKAEVDMQIPGATLKSEAMSQVGSLQTGLQYKLMNNLTLGFEAIHIIDELKVKLPDGTEMKDDYEINYLAGGFSWKPIEKLLIAFDYRWGQIKGKTQTPLSYNDIDVDVHRWYVGASYELVDNLSLNTGSANAAFSAGFQFIFNEKWELSYAYQKDSFRDKAELLGETDVHGISLSYQL